VPSHLRTRLLTTFFALLTISLAAGCDAREPPAQAPSTGNAAVDKAIDDLRALRTDDILDRIEFTPIRCIVEPAIGDLGCPDGTADGALVAAFGVSQCEGYFLTSIDEVRDQVQALFEDNDAASLYAVLRGRDDDRPGEEFVAAINWGEFASPTADGLLWYLTPEGGIYHLVVPCDVGIGRRIKFFGLDDFVVGPLGSCLPPPGDTANLVVRVDGIGGDALRGVFYGPATSTIGGPPRERSIVNVNPATIWLGRRKKLGDARPGDELQAVGPREDDCSITAERVFSPLPEASNEPPRVVIESHLVQDIDANGAFSIPDAPALALVELRIAAVSLYVFPAADGLFRLDDLPDGEYTLRIHWRGGSNEAAFDDGIYSTSFVVTPGTLEGEGVPGLPSGRIMLRPLSDGEEPFVPPLADIQSIPVGTLNVREALLGNSSSGLRHYENQWLNVALRFPSRWIGDRDYGAVFGATLTSFSDPGGRERGYVYLNAISSPSFDVAVEETAYHKLRPFGEHPALSERVTPAGTGMLILPDPARGDLLEATFIIPYPEPLTGLFLGPYQYFELVAHVDFIESILNTLDFVN
jgi:hypothetical protein